MDLSFVKGCAEFDDVAIWGLKILQAFGAAVAVPVVLYVRMLFATRYATFWEDGRFFELNLEENRRLINELSLYHLLSKTSLAIRV